jgi:hypothetical protein
MLINVVNESSVFGPVISFARCSPEFRTAVTAEIATAKYARASLSGFDHRIAASLPPSLDAGNEAKNWNWASWPRCAAPREGRGY